MNALERRLYDRLLSEREVHFRFRKENGEIRDARGTCNLDYVPLDKRPHHHVPMVETIRYYDYDRKDWRSFRFGALIAII